MTIAVDPRIWLAELSPEEERQEAHVAGGGRRVKRPAISRAGVTVRGTDDGIELRFVTPLTESGDGVDTLYDSPCRCFVEATVSAAGLPAEWRDCRSLVIELTVAESPLDLEWALVGARSRLLDRRVCEPGEHVLTVDTREIPLIQGKEPSWNPVAVRLGARPTAGQQAAVVLRRIELLPGDEPVGPVLDWLGQRMHGNWPAKMRDESELADDLAAERRELEQVSGRPDRTRHHGWTEGPRFEGSGFFRVEQDGDGRWWYVDPDGAAYWSFGPTCVRLRDNTSVPGREELFEELPPREHPGRWREDDTVCFHGTNAMRKYGSEQAWVEHTCRRLIAWGATCIGNWSDRSVIHSGLIPATADLTSRLGPVQAGGLADVFDVRWAAAFEEHVRSETAPLLGKPWFVGWFVDNEMGWHRPRFLEAPPDAAIRRVWLDIVRKEFPDVAGFCAATGCRCDDWDAVAGLEQEALGESEAAERLRGKMLAVYAKRYFGEVRRILKEADPDHLYLGCRFVRNRPAEAVVRAASVCDVVTVNAYSIVPERDAFDEWHRLCGRPIQIGEHQYAQWGPYLPPPVWPCLTAEERRRWFPEYVRTAASLPYCVGSHWFQYVDQAGTGRPSNGENMAIGWIDVVDRPHPEMIDAVREIGDKIYRWHSA